MGFTHRQEAEEPRGPTENPDLFQQTVPLAMNSR